MKLKGTIKRWQPGERVVTWEIDLETDEALHLCNVVFDGEVVDEDEDLAALPSVAPPPTKLAS